MFHDSPALRVADVSALVGELFSLIAFNSVSLCCVFDILTVICCGDLFLWSCLFGGSRVLLFECLILSPDL